jgi:toxin ParE1/3/4
MAEIIWTEPALNDLDAIAGYIALDKKEAAKRLVRNVFSSIERLKDHPESGRKPPELSSQRYRELIIVPCRVFYRYEYDRVYILYIMRTERTLRERVIENRLKNI